MKVGFGIFDARFASSGWYFLLLADCEQTIAHDGHMTGHILLTQENTERGFIIRFKPRKTGSCLEKLFEMGFIVKLRFSVSF